MLTASRKFATRDYIGLYNLWSQRTVSIGKWRHLVIRHENSMHQLVIHEEPENNNHTSFIFA